jgi:DNA-binding GntR family transcriptional regulator
MRTSNPIFQKALRFLGEGLEQGRWTEGERLPSLSRLSQLCHVSIGTLHKAVAHLSRLGRIAAERGGRLYAGSSPSSHATAHHTSSIVLAAHCTSISNLY